MNPSRPPLDAPASNNPGKRPATDLPRIVLAIAAQLLLIGGSLYVLRPFIPALIWGAMIVVATWPGLIGLQHRLGGRRGVAVLIMLLIQIVVIILPIYAAISTLAERAPEITEFIHGLPAYALPSPPGSLANVPFIGTRLSHDWQALSDAGPGGVLARLQPYVATAATWMLERVSKLGLFLVYLVLMLIVCGLLYAKGESAALLVKRFAERVSPHNGEEIVTLISQSIRAIALGVVVTAIVQASLGTLGIWVAGVPFAGVLSAVLLIFCLVQIGPLLPLIGCVAWVFFNGSRLTAILLLIWSIGVAMLDNILRPILIRRAIEMPMVLILTGVLGGLLSIGVVGLFIGPVVLAVTYHLMLAWIDSPSRASGPVSGPAEETPTDTAPASDHPAPPAAQTPARK